MYFFSWPYLKACFKLIMKINGYYFFSVKSKYKYEILYCSVKHIEPTVKPYQ